MSQSATERSRVAAPAWRRPGHWCPRPSDCPPCPVPAPSLWGRGRASCVQPPTAEAALHARSIGAGKPGRGGAWRASPQQGPLSPCLCGHFTKALGGPPTASAACSAPPAPRPRPPPHTAGRSRHRCPAPMSLARRTKPRVAAPALLPAHCSSPVPGTTAEPAAAPGPAQHPGDSQLGPQTTQRTAGRLLSTRRCGREGGSPLPPVSQLGPPGGIRRGAGSGG